MNKLILGSQVSLKYPRYLKGVVEQQVLFGGNAMMFFVGSPQTFKQLPKDRLDTKLFHELLKKNKIDLNHVFIHASYLVNFFGILFKKKCIFNIDRSFESDLWKHQSYWC